MKPNRYMQIYHETKYIYKSGIKELIKTGR